MLQRIQTVYWALTIVISIAFFFVPISEVSVNDSLYQIKASGVYYFDIDNFVFDSPLVPLSSVLLFHVLLTAICIFQFKNRTLQIKLSGLNLILLLITLGLAFFYAGDVPEPAKVNTTETVDYTYGALVLFAPMILTILARAAVLKDEKLVKSLDRLR